MKRLLNGIRNLWMFGIRYRWVTVGRGVVCQLSARFWSQNRRIRIGNRVGIGFHCLFQSDITVGDDVWIGLGAIVMSPADIGRGSIVAAGSVVKGRVEPYSIVAGVPARILRRVLLSTPAAIAT